ncbi:MAG: DUF1320 domain-containing protein [Desulforhopalus sp.]|jgi:phage gp36-like protein|nr:DUF1320 domain-containing protein [Desulforhopalus sp.]
MTAYCTADDLKEHVLQAYLDKLEELHPGILEKHIAGVSGEIDDVLRGRYVLPLSTVPETLRRIAAVLACYRSVGDITSLMDTSAATDNQFLYIQDMVKQARKDLELIRKGEIDLGLTVLGEEEVSPGNIRVLASDKYFDFTGY